MDLESDNLLRILVLLLIIWVAIEIVTEVISFVFGPFLALLRPVLGLLVIVLIVLWVLDRI